MKTPREYSPDQIAAMREAVIRLKNKSAAAVELDIPRNTLLRYTTDLEGSPLGGGFNPIHAGKHPERGAASDVRPGREPITVDRSGPAPPPVAATPEPPPRQIDWQESGDSANVAFTSDRLVRTEAEALSFAEVDTSIWYVKKWSCGGWSTAMRTRNGQDENGRWRADSGHVKQNWTVKLELARILPKPFQEASNAIFERMALHAPDYPVVHRVKPKHPHLLELDLFDVHFGKLAWKAETGQDYDLRIASDVYRNAVRDLVAHASGFDVERVVMTIGSDMFHVDNHNSTTTSGTYVDSDGRFAKIIETVEGGVVSVIDELLGVAPVDVIWIPGNHDKIAGHHLARTLSAWFRNCGDVSVDLSPKSRKYYEFGKNLLGYTHGHREPHQRLPILMATEEPEAWARTTRRAWRIGHFHHSRKTETRSVADHDGVSVQILQSLSGKDAWHFEAGYGGRQAAEAFLLSKDGNTAANFQVAARESA